MKYIILILLTTIAFSEEDKITLEMIGFKKLYEHQEMFVKIIRRDGIIVVSDINEGKIWINGADGYQVIRDGIKVVKTFGGAPGIIPIMFVGENLAYASTVKLDEDYQLNGNIPLGYAVTKLISKNGNEIDVSMEYLYDHTPWLCIKKEWMPNGKK